MRDGQWQYWLSVDGTYQDLYTFVPEERGFLVLPIERGAPLPQGVTPLLAGKDIHGRRLYVGMHGDSKTIGNIDSYVALTEDMIPVNQSFRDDSELPEDYQLAVLITRFDPIDWSEHVDRWRGVDPTGSYYWQNRKP